MNARLLSCAAAVAGIGLLTALLPVSPAAARWTTQSTPSSGLLDVACPVIDRCYAVGNSGSFTVLSGGTWSALSAGTTQHLFGIACPGADECWVTGQGGTLRRTTNGGASWSSYPGGGLGQINDVSCPSLALCLAVDASGGIYRWNGGNTWAAQTSGTSADLRGISCPTVSFCAVSGALGTLLVSTDGGTTWFTRATGTTSHLYGVHCMTTVVCWGVGDGGTIVASADGGTTWAPQASGTSIGLRGVTCAGMSCWVVGAGTILGSPDRGATWGPQPSGTTAELRSVACPTATRCWSVSLAGTAHLYDPPSAPTITSGPTATTASTSATFEFSGAEAMGEFHCRLDTAAFVTCSSPRSYSGIADGTHTFQVRQVDSAGNASPTASRTWTVDAVQQCNDGADNDRDGRSDYPDDLGCAGPTDDSEGPTCAPPAPGVIACLAAGAVLQSFTIASPEVAEDPLAKVAAYVENYRFVVGGVTVVMPCVRLVTSPLTASPCATAGGVLVERVATLVEADIPGLPGLIGSPLVSITVCSAELTLTVGGAGIESAPAVTIC